MQYTLNRTKDLSLSRAFVEGDKGTKLNELLKMTPNLEAIDLTGIRLTASDLSKIDFGLTKKLNDVHLSYNPLGTRRFGGEAGLAIQKMLDNTPNLKRLSLVETRLNTHDMGPVDFGASTKLEFLDMSNNEIGSLGVLASFKRPSPSLETLILNKAELADANDVPFPMTPNLKVVSMADNRFVDLTDLPLSSVRELEAMSLANNRIDTTGFNGANFAHNPHLYWLDLRGNRFGVRHNTNFQLKNLGALQTLYLSENGLDKDWAASADFMGAPMMSNVDVTHNALGPEGAASLHARLPKVPPGGLAMDLELLKAQ